MRRGREEGAITLEACVSVLVFLVLMLFLAGFFKMYMAQNATAHTLLQTSQSLSVDEYSAEKLGNNGLASVGDFSILFWKEYLIAMIMRLTQAVMRERLLTRM